MDSSDDIDALSEDFIDFSLSQTDLPIPKEYKAADGKMKPRAGSFWWEVKTFDGQPRFPNLIKLMSGLLSIPASNTDSELGFSIFRKIHTDQHSNLDQTTIIALMSIKFTSDECCHNIKYSGVAFQL